ncbi:hypothetical protein [Crocosphaera sp. Alani8]|uniref:hypothetical protein n=1 Tax=Crocosphaera sp. Alani8 TaxID=3038952 RepID=UPI00313AF59A
MSQQNTSKKTERKKEKKTWPIFFRSKEATVGEFVILLIVGLGGYGYWHWIDQPKPTLSTEATEIVESTSETISDIQKELFNSKPEPTDEQVENSGEQLEELQSELKVFSQEIFIPNANEIDQILEKIIIDFNKIKDLENEEEKDKILENIGNNLINLQTILTGRELFWSNNKKWVEVICWTLFGTLLYLIQQTAEYRLRVDNKIKEDKNNQGNEDNQEGEDKGNEANKRRAENYLQRHKRQYYSFLLRGPFISLSILWVLNASNLNIAGFSLQLSEISPKVLVSLAFILGYFNRVAISQLNLIVSAIFKDAWDQTVRNIDIDPCAEKVEYGSYCNFSVIPDVKVQWSILSHPKTGTIDAATGMFIAPPKAGYYCETNGEGQLE